MDYLVIIRFSVGHCHGRHADRDEAIKIATRQMHILSRAMCWKLSGPIVAAVYRTDQSVWWDERNTYLDDGTDARIAISEVVSIDSRTGRVGRRLAAA